MAEENDPAPVKKPEERKDFLKEAREIAERNEKALAEMREITERQEEIAGRNLLGGETRLEKPEEKKEESNEEYAQRVLRGEL